MLTVGAGGKDLDRDRTASRLSQTNPPPVPTHMGRAIGFGMVMVVLAVLLPDVFSALAIFLQVFLESATNILEAIH
ncbi:MAG: hypothetical protein COU11_01915 [Candidatus Harrisonbacteria bacterium CG10_big_fil_rev_8_21_14_0_10_49_15]|uniref:Uncharacterized protein n=1 Tax=Candidatus Harrisonbacteria bacterium CG10_big_fil_rev_8_21_14_0_10_49_15 TaxID=1974587 RepID=A0A2H0UL72_9BACT|nr:MAG: hypothetical protein COU11_01915 [Candidatus Harrisonbacteria bacterium CG10_big_fil_rev_8_21_14_0_10_49_15]